MAHKIRLPDIVCIYERRYCARANYSLLLTNFFISLPFILYKTSPANASNTITIYLIILLEYSNKEDILINSVPKDIIKRILPL